MIKSNFKDLLSYLQDTKCEYLYLNASLYEKYPYAPNEPALKYPNVIVWCDNQYEMSFKKDFSNRISSNDRLIFTLWQRFLLNRIIRNKINEFIDAENRNRASDAVCNIIESL